jgi:hypothetical protein
MSQQITIPSNFGAVSALFGGGTTSNDELGAGVSSSYAVMGYRGKVWAIKHAGKETPLMRDDGDGPRGSIEVVILKSAAAVSKIFYKGGYVDGANQAPDCWSSNGQTPDSSAQNKQHPTCAACPMNAWGSRVTESGKQGKACADSRRLAIVPVNDIANELMDGPMLLRVPAASLKDLKAYGDTLNSYGYPYYAVATRISFDPKEPYPKFVFGAIRPLTDAEAKQVLTVRNDHRVAQLLNESVDLSQPQQEAPAAPAIFEQPAAAPVQVATPPAAPKAVAKKKAEPAPAPIVAPAPEVTSEGSAPASFDSLLEDIL